MDSPIFPRTTNGSNHPKGVRAIAPEENCPPVRLRVRVKIGVRSRVGGGKCPRTCPEVLYKKVAGLRLIKKETLAQVFSCEVCEICKNAFFTEHLRSSASEVFTFFSKLYLLLVNVCL